MGKRKSGRGGNAWFVLSPYPLAQGKNGRSHQIEMALLEHLVFIVE